MKSILTILFLSILSVKGQYLIVSSEAKARAISKTFYQSSRPERGNDVTEYLFEWVNNDSTGQSAVLIDTTIYIPKGNITVTQVDNWLNEVYGTSLTTTQKNAVRNYISSRSLIYVKDIIVGGKLTLVTYEYLQANGWFPAYE